MNDRTHRDNHDLDVQIEFLERLIQRDPYYVEALQILGDAYTKRGDYQKGLDIDRRLAALLPNDGLVLYNLACSLALSGDVNAAFDALQKAVHNGYDDVSWMQKDSDLQALRQDSRFHQLIAQIAARKK
jgi:tetratricopeptide (TPR) repeat protein